MQEANSDQNRLEIAVGPVPVPAGQRHVDGFFVRHAVAACDYASAGASLFLGLAYLANMHHPDGSLESMVRLAPLAIASAPVLYSRHILIDAGTADVPYPENPENEDQMRWYKVKKEGVKRYVGSYACDLFLRNLTLGVGACAIYEGISKGSASQVFGGVVITGLSILIEMQTRHAVKQVYDYVPKIQNNPPQKV